jgi:hypothetical protein
VKKFHCTPAFVKGPSITDTEQMILFLVLIL